MKKATQLNQQATCAYNKMQDQKIKETEKWIEAKLFPYLEKLAEQGRYDTRLTKCQCLASNTYKFESLDCPKCGLCFDTLSEVLQKENFSIIDNPSSYQISWRT